MKLRIVSAVMALILLAPSVLAHAQTGGGYNLEWNTIDNGGATFATGGGYELGGAIGQPDAGAMAGGGYSLVGGFWNGAAAQRRIYLPLVLRDAN